MRRIIVAVVVVVVLLIAIGAVVGSKGRPA
jgi:hypothetical protein